MPAPEIAGVHHEHGTTLADTAEVRLTALPLYALMNRETSKHLAGEINAFHSGGLPAWPFIFVLAVSHGRPVYHYKRLERAKILSMPMTPQSMGRKGGQAKTPAKMRAASRNLELARKRLKELRRKLALDNTKRFA